MSSYCCNRHLWCYDGGRLGRVKTVTLNLTPLLLTRPIFSSILEFHHGAFVSKTFARPKKTPALQAKPSAEIKLISNLRRIWNSSAINSSNQNAFSHLRDLRPSFKMAVQLQNYVLPFGSKPRPSEKKTHLVFREAKRVSRERGISWSTQDQQKSKLWLREVRFSRGHWERSVR